MAYSPEQQFFLDLVNEAKTFIGSDFPLNISFTNFPHTILPGDLKATRYYPPVIPDYDNGILYVLDNWLHDCVKDYLPTVIRSQAYYYTYTFHVFHKEQKGIENYPLDANALAFCYGLCLLNGIPMLPTEIPGLKHVTGEDICSMLSNFTGRRYSIIRSIAPDGNPGVSLSLDKLENKRLKGRLQCIRQYNNSRKIKINYGTIDKPFPNIDEAIKYINFLESEEVKNDLYLNSQFITDTYRYDFFEGAKISGGLYKIPWASAVTAHVKNDFQSNSFIVTQLNPANDDWEWLSGDKMRKTFIPVFALKPNLYKRRFLFRGQTEEYIDPKTNLPTCKPNLYRDDVEANPLPHRIKAYEMACLVARHPLVQLLGINGVKIFNEPFRFQLNRLGLAQHYYNKTSYIDLTSDIEVAKFFATTSYCKHDDKYYPFTSDEKLGVIYIYDIRYPDEFNHYKLPQLSTIGKQYVFPRSAMQSGFLLNMPNGLNLHDLPNVYRIFFRHNREISEQTIIKTSNGDKFFPKDPLSHVWQNMRQAPNSAFTISLKAREMYLKFHNSEGLNHKSLDALLIANGFRLGDNLWPEFPKEVLDEYYENSLSTWGKFCSDIEFLGLEGRFMKKALLNLPYNNEYRNYFFK